LPDHRPAIVWDGGQMLRVNGLYRHGYMIAPEVADQAVGFALALADGAIAGVDAFADWRRQAQWSELFHVDHPQSRDAVRESV
jgi:glycine oxidase